jgi:prevent-host-death family protein
LREQAIDVRAPDAIAGPGVKQEVMARSTGVISPVSADGGAGARGYPGRQVWAKVLAKEVVMVAESSSQFNIHEAKTNLSRIIERVEHGEEIIISRAGTPVAKVVPLTRTIHRMGRGSLRGQLVVTPDWDSDEVNDAIADDFGMAR